jgi:hypothetical protein
MGRTVRRVGQGSEVGCRVEPRVRPRGVSAPGLARPHRFVAAALFAAGCAGGDAPEATPDPLAAPGWELEEVFRLGGASPAPPEAFSGVPPLVVDGADRLFALHQTQGLVAVFDAEGAFLHWIRGGRGNGPGEFTSPMAMGFVGDTLWIRNLSPPRISRFLSDGAHLGTDAVLVERSQMTTAGVQGVSGYLGGGRAWMAPDGFPMATGEGPPPRSALVLGDRSMTGRDTVLTWRSERGRIAGLGFEPVPEPPFYDRASDGSGIVVAEWSADAPGQLGLRMVAPDGSEAWRRDLAFVPVPFDRAERDALVQEARERVDRLRESLLEQGLPPGALPDVPTTAQSEATLLLPDYLPPIRSVRWGAGGLVWLERSRGADLAGGPQEWVAFDPASGAAGEALFQVTLPGGARFGHATRDALWYAHVDSMGVPWVVKASPRFRPTP